MGGFFVFSLDSPGGGRHCSLGLLRSRVALAAQLRLTLSYQVCFDATCGHLDGRGKCWFSSIKIHVTI